MGCYNRTRLGPKLCPELGLCGVWSPTIRHAPCLNEFGIWLHFMCSLEASPPYTSVSLTEASLILLFAMGISQRAGIIVCAHWKDDFYLIFQGGDFTKNDRLVTCNPISSGYSSHFPSSVQTFGNFWSKLMWACKLRTYITCAMGTASTCQYLHCFALVSCTSNGNYISMLHWHYNWSLMVRACRNLTHVDISPSSLSRLYFLPYCLASCNLAEQRMWAFR